MHWMILHCLEPRRPRHKTENKSRINRYRYEKTTCKSRYCENCVLEHCNMTWFQVIKWGKIFRCNGCREPQGKQEEESALTCQLVDTPNRWYADPRGTDHMNRGALDDPQSRAGKSQDNFYSFGRRLLENSTSGDKDQKEPNNQLSDTSEIVCKRQRLQ